MSDWRYLNMRDILRRRRIPPRKRRILRGTRCAVARPGVHRCHGNCRHVRRTIGYHPGRKAGRHEMSNVNISATDTPAAWSATELEGDRRWVYALDDRARRDLVEAVRKARDPDKTLLDYRR